MRRDLSIQEHDSNAAVKVGARVSSLRCSVPLAALAPEPDASVSPGLYAAFYLIGFAVEGGNAAKPGDDAGPPEIGRLRRPP
jgi:hypothetical protein